MVLRFKREIEQAAKEKRVLRIAYVDLKQQESIRNVEPYEIRDGMLWAYCRKKKSTRQFALDRIRRATVTRYSYFPKYPDKITTPLEKTAAFVFADLVFGPYEDAPVD